jgi:hypothetical protein
MVMKRSEWFIQMFMRTVRNAERLETFVPKRSNALERIVENVYVHDSKTKDQLYYFVYSIIIILNI